jgi:WD40 repeat protein
VRSVAYSPDGQHIISGSDDKTIRIWDAETGAAVGKPLEGHTDCVWSVAYSPDGQHIISGSDDKTIRIWDAETGAAVGKPLEGHTGVCVCCLLSRWAAHHLWI